MVQNVFPEQDSTGHLSPYQRPRACPLPANYLIIIIIIITRKSYRASVAQCKVSAYAPSCRRCVATYWKDHADTASTKLQISPLIANAFENGFQQWIQHIFLVVLEAKRNFSEIFFCFQNLDPLYGPVAGKAFVLEDLVLGMHVN